MGWANDSGGGAGNQHAGARALPEEFSQSKIDVTINELKEERDAVKGLIPGAV